MQRRKGNRKTQGRQKNEQIGMQAQTMVFFAPFIDLSVPLR
jgi:hypothetical protein